LNQYCSGQVLWRLRDRLSRVCNTVSNRLVTTQQNRPKGRLTELRRSERTNEIRVVRRRPSFYGRITCHSFSNLLNSKMEWTNVRSKSIRLCLQYL